MKMRETSPARVLPCHYGGLVLTCLILVSLFVMNTLGSHQVESHTSRQLPEAMPSQFNSSHTASPPTTATFQMECFSPGGHIYDLCWLNDNTMVMAHFIHNKVLKAIINRQNKTCTYVELDSPPGPLRVACSPEGGEFYVINYEQSSVWVYDGNSSKAVWKPEGLVGKPITVAMNRDRIVVGTEPKGHLYIYNRKRVYIGQISILKNAFEFDYTLLSDEGLFVASTGTNGHRLIIHDFYEGISIAIGGEGPGNGQFRRPLGVSIVRDYILVSDNNNDRVPVFSTYGGFRGNLLFKGAQVSRPYCQAYRSQTNLLALKVNIAPFDNIKIFSLV